MPGDDLCRAHAGRGGSQARPASRFRRCGRALASIRTFLDWDLTTVDLDAPPPPPPFTQGWQSQKLFYDLAVESSVRQLVSRMSAARGHLVLVGTPAEVVDELQAWFEDGAADGFNILAPIFPAGLDDVIELVLPELRRRGLFRREYEGKTLRENLGWRALAPAFPPPSLPNRRSLLHEHACPRCRAPHACGGQARTAWPGAADRLFQPGHAAWRRSKCRSAPMCRRSMPVLSAFRWAR
jgi:hypothetical protein